MHFFECVSNFINVYGLRVNVPNNEMCSRNKEKIKRKKIFEKNYSTVYKILM